MDSADYRAIDYERAYTRLCHLAALTTVEQIDGALDNLVLTTSVLSPESSHRPLDELRQAVQALFGLRLPETDLDSATRRLVASGRLIEEGDRFYVASEDEARIATRADESAGLERSVRALWLAQVAEITPESAPITDDQLWACLSGFMARVFRRHGVQSLQLLAPDLPTLAAAEGSLTAFFEESAKEARIAPEGRDYAKRSLDLFFNEQDADRTRYLAQLLDGTFTFYALTVDEATAEFLRGQVPPLNVFLDTNFIFAVIGLHEDYFAEISADVLRLIQEQRLPFRLYYHERTLVEIEQTIYAIGARLRERRWSQALSAAAFTFGSQTGAISGVELNYHRLNAARPVDPDAFLSKYKHIDVLLKDKGFRIYRETRKPDYSVEEKGELIAEYEAYVRDARPGRPKPYDALDHDVVVLMRVERLQENPRSILSAGAVLLTNDFLLHRFVWKEIRRVGEIGLAVLPRQLLQVLRPFVRTTDDFDRRFVETFAIPEFRGLQPDLALTTSKVLGFLATYKDIKEETALRILSDTVLQNRVRGIHEDDPKFREAIDAAVVSENAQLLEERDELQQALQRTRLEIQSARSEQAEELATRDQAVARLESTLRQQAEDVKALMARANEAERETLARKEAEAREAALLAAERKTREELERRLSGESHDVDRLQLALVVAVSLIGVGGLAATIFLAPIPGLADHPRRLGLLIASGLVMIGLTWLAIKRTHVGLVVLGVVVVGALTVAQLIDTGGALPLP